MLFNIQQINRGDSKNLTVAYFSATKIGNLFCCIQIKIAISNP
jgi:hypothetical protein